MTRHFGMDWLRIGAFAVLILYHAGMVFVPWGYHAKTAEPADWVVVPMLLTGPWRLSLLFLVSGYASRALLARHATPITFLRNRFVRLIVPLAFGVAVIVPPQPWTELTTQHGYTAGYLHFWLNDYFRFGTLSGIPLPTWNHLWFVGYLMIYTLAVGVIALLPWPRGLQHAFDRVFGGTRALWLPLGWLFITQVVVFTRWTDTHDVIGDGVAHLAYFPTFLFGFALARSSMVMAEFMRWWIPAAIIALAAYGYAAWVAIMWPGGTPTPRRIAEGMMWARQVQCWFSIVALIGFASRYLNRDHPWRATLTEAVFPFYIIHQTIIVVVAGMLLGHGVHPVAEFAIIVAATTAGCWAFYLVGREIGWLRPLIGLRRRVAGGGRSATTPALI